MAFLKYFFSYFSLKTGFDTPCKFSPKETVCMKCQTMFSGENGKNINLSSAESAQGEIKVIYDFKIIMYVFLVCLFFLLLGFFLSNVMT